MINETRYIDILQKLSMEGFKTYHIEDFDKLTLHLQSIGLTDSFNISILMHLRDTNYKKMSEIAVLFDDIGEVFAMKKKKMVARMHDIRKILKQKLEMIRAFKKIDKINNFTVLEGDEKLDEENSLDDTDNTDDSDYFSGTEDRDIWSDIDQRSNYQGNDTGFKKPLNLKSKLNSRNINTVTKPRTTHNIADILAFGLEDNQIYKTVATKQKLDGTTNISRVIPPRKKMGRQYIESEWRYYTKIDLIDRLHLLAEQHFTINQLRYMNVELKYISEVKKMTHLELEQYYLNVVTTIDHVLKEWMMICRMYIDIEVNYIECCENLINGAETNLDLKHFSIDIRNI